MPHEHASGAEIRELCRAGELTGPTPGMAMGYVQANLVVVPRELAYDFLLFCQRNPKPCPLLDVTDVGDPEPKHAAPGTDLRTDLPRYCVYRHGKIVDEPTDINAYWRANSVGFLIGCSFTFENSLLRNGLTPRHIEEGRNVPMYRTNIPCRSSGPFEGPMVVSMRPYSAAHALRASAITARYPLAHGAAVHFGDPSAIGIKDLAKPHYGDAVTVREGEVPVFWACGVTPQAVAMTAGLPLLVTHKPGHMLVTNLRDINLLAE